MKKFLIFATLIFTTFLLNECQKPPEPYRYLSYNNKQFKYQSLGVYKSDDNEYVYYQREGGVTIITMSFSDVIIEMKPPQDPKVIFPDGCSAYIKVTNGFVTTYSHQSVGHFHNYASFARLTFEQLDDTELKEYRTKKSMISPLVIMSIIFIYTSFFVFKPSNIRRMIKFWNRIFPFYEEPFEPTGLNIGITYLANLLVFVVSLFFIIFTIIILLK